jgi:SAM-dependent methyltransferase
MSNQRPSDTDLRDAVRDSYAARALQTLQGSACCAPGECDEITRDLYDDGQTADVPDGAVRISLGCGNPVALAELHEGETVLDLGSGGGIDVLLSADRVGPAGFAYGLDMTDEMLALAEKHRAEAGAENVRFLKGHIEDIPLEQASVDVVISNCVINLSYDKGRVLRETFRVLRPGGRFAVSDVIVRGEMPESVRRDMAAWADCVGGALEEREFRRLLDDAGYEDVSFEVTRKLDVPAMRGWIQGELVSAFVRARKPDRGESAA